VLKFAGTKIDSTKETFETYDLLLNELEKELGIPVEYYPTDSNPAIAEAFISGRVDIALMSVLGYLGASQTVSNVELIGVTKRLGVDLPGYYSIGITKKNSGINSIADLAGQKVCLSSPASVTGDLLPTKAMLDVGIEARFDKPQDLEVAMLGTSVLAFGSVRDGDCIAGFGLDSSFTTYMPDSGEINPDEFDIFWTSERIPGAPLVVRGDLPGGLSEKIANAFVNVMNKSSFVEMGVCTSEEDCPLLAQNLWGFVPASQEGYEFIKVACAETGYEICR
jgi:phosphonate transport system substrate-binding protein